MRDVVEVVALLALAYFVAININYLGFTLLAWRGITNYLHEHVYAGNEDAFASPLSPGISILLPAYNEEAGIVESIHSLLALRYPKFEVIAINDGSKDSTLEQVTKEFGLVEIRKALRSALETAPVNTALASAEHTNLLVIDKANGGKADALNCGINAARYPYICAVDADAILEEEALLKVAKPVIDDPGLVKATGGIVRIANGCTIEHGRVIDVRLPKSRLATLQVIEYLRAFLVGRTGWSRLGSLLIISGAFGLFERATVEEVDGYSTDTIGEDMELVVRMHHHLRQLGEPYSVAFIPDPVCWTEAPEQFKALSSQRRRWQRGLIEALWRHRQMLGNPRYGTVGTLAFPFFFLFEALGPIFELLGYISVPLAVIMGVLDPVFLLLFFVLAVVLGVLLSVSALAIEEFSFRRHERNRDVARLFVAAVIENFGYRQLIALWRAATFIDLFKPRTWGEMPRKGIGEASVERPSSDGQADLHLVSKDGTLE